MLIVACVLMSMPGEQRVAFSGTYKALGDVRSDDDLTVSIGPIVETQIVSKAARKGIQDASSHMDQLVKLSAQTKLAGSRDLKTIYQNISETLKRSDAAASESIESVLSEALSADLLSMEKAMESSASDIKRTEIATTQLNEMEKQLKMARTIAGQILAQDAILVNNNGSHSQLQDDYDNIMTRISRILKSDNNNMNIISSQKAPQPQDDFINEIQEKLSLVKAQTKIKSSRLQIGYQSSSLYELDNAIDYVTAQRKRTSAYQIELQLSQESLRLQRSRLRNLRKEIGLSYSGRYSLASKFDILEKTRISSISNAINSEPIVLSILGKPSAAIFTDQSVDEAIFLKSEPMLAKSTGLTAGYETILYGVPQDHNADGQADIIDCLAIVRTFNGSKPASEKVIVFSLERS